MPASNVTATSSFEYKDVGAIHQEMGAVHNFAGIDIDYNAYKSKSTTNYPHNDQINITASGIGIRIEETGNPKFSRLTQTARSVQKLERRNYAASR